MFAAILKRGAGIAYVMLLINSITIQGSFELNLTYGINCPCYENNSYGCDEMGKCQCRTGFMELVANSLPKFYLFCNCVNTTMLNWCDNKGYCECAPSYYGKSCNKSCTCHTLNSLNNSCNQYGACRCKDGFTGAKCSQSCSCSLSGIKLANICNADGTCDCKNGYYGRKCDKKCNCYNCTSLLDECNDYGYCLCVPGFYGKRCTKTCECEHFPALEWCDSNGFCVCTLDKYGPNCEHSCQCSHNSMSQSCDYLGYCSCKPGWKGKTCTEECFCDNEGSTESCDSNGYCVCRSGYYGKFCNQTYSTCGQIYLQDWYFQPTSMRFRQINSQPLNFFPVPWLAKIMKNGVYVCSGAIITDRWILTLKRCIDLEGDTSTVFIKVGDYSTHHWDIDERVYAIKEVIHYTGLEAFEGSDLEKLMLIKIGGVVPNEAIQRISVHYHKYRITFSSSIQPICLHDGSSLINKELLMSSWGMTHYTNQSDFASSIKFRESPHPNRYCSRMDDYERESLICASAERDQSIGCSNHYGSTLNYRIGDRYVLVGLWAMSESCSGTAGHYFINVNKYNQWIMSKIR